MLAMFGLMKPIPYNVATPNTLHRHYILFMFIRPFAPPHQTKPLPKQNLHVHQRRYCYNFINQFGGIPAIDTAISLVAQASIAVVHHAFGGELVFYVIT